MLPGLGQSAGHAGGVEVTHVSPEGMRVSAWGLTLEGDLDDDGFLVVKKLFPGGPVALASADAAEEDCVVREGDVLLGVGDAVLSGLSEADLRKLVADSRSLASIELHFGHQLLLASGRTLEEFSVRLGAEPASEADERVDLEGDVVDVSRKASKKLSRAKKAAEQAGKVKTRHRPEKQVLSEYGKQLAAAPPIWVPPPPEYGRGDLQVAASRAPRQAHPLAEASKVWVCGNNTDGELGLGHRRFVPGPRAVQLPRLPGRARRNTSTPHAAAAGEGFSVICFGTETAVCGSQVDGRLGVGNAGVDLLYLTRIPALSGVAVHAVACGHAHCIALAAGSEGEATAFGWGANRHGQLGLGAGVADVVGEPVQVVALRGMAVSAVGAGRAHSLVLEAGGRGVWSFGSNELGQLGRDVRGAGDEGGGEVAGEARGGRQASACWWPHPAPLPRDGGVSTGTADGEDMRVVGMAVGANHSLVVTHGGRVYSWGCNENGECGTGTPDKVLWRPVRMVLPSGEHAYLGACGALHSVVVTRHSGGGGAQGHTSRRPASSVLTCGSGGCWQLGAGVTQADRRVPQVTKP